jgi:lysophospholipid acyltransferase (LPLAT)-like uncharacterized protein
MLPFFASIIGWFYISLVGTTSRLLARDHPEFTSLDDSGGPFVYVFWHRVQFFLAYPHRRENLAILVSLSRDGELIARTLHRFGLATIRGSSSHGGIQALSDMIETLKNGMRVAVTPDGPRGPLWTVHPGAALAALKTDLPIVPVACAARRALVFKSWDEYIVPLPFNRIGLVHGKPLRLDPLLPVEDHCARIRQSLDAVMKEAASLL